MSKLLVTLSIDTDKVGPIVPMSVFDVTEASSADEMNEKAVNLEHHSHAEIVDMVRDALDGNSDLFFSDYCTLDKVELDGSNILVD